MKEQPSRGSSSFDFDEWSALARTDPEAFDLKRRTWINDSIGHGADQRRLRGLQCRIDLERMRAHTPLKACLRLSSLMWDSFYELCDTSVLLSAATDRNESQATPSKSQPSAAVLPFRKAARAN